MKAQLIALLCLFPTLLHAHPGHDHQHWLSSPIHLLTALAIIAIPAVAYTLIRINKAKDN